MFKPCYNSKLKQIQFQEETKLAKEKEAFKKQLKKLDLVLPQLSSDEISFLHPTLNKYEAEKDIHYKKIHLQYFIVL